MTKPHYGEIEFVDSHTEGEPTRIVIAGGPHLGNGDFVERREIFQNRFDTIRSAVVNEPRGSDVLIGGLLCEPNDPNCTAGVVFFNTAGCLGMCGHGSIGLMATLHYLGRAAPGVHRIETPVGVITATLHDHCTISIENVPSFRTQKDVRVSVPDYGTVIGDVAWGGNWFFLVKEHQERLGLNNVDRLLAVTRQIERALAAANIRGDGGARIDHIELFADGRSFGADAQSFVLCPGGSYDRSPCGTGTSAKLACLAADGLLEPGQVWRQAGMAGGVFEATFRRHNGDAVIPTITGRAFVTARGRLLLQSDDPFCFGIRP